MRILPEVRRMSMHHRTKPRVENVQRLDSHSIIQVVLAPTLLISAFVVTDVNDVSAKATSYGFPCSRWANVHVYLVSLRSTRFLLIIDSLSQVSPYPLNTSHDGRQF